MAAPLTKNDWMEIHSSIMALEEVNKDLHDFSYTLGPSHRERIQSYIRANNSQLSILKRLTQSMLEMK